MQGVGVAGKKKTLQQTEPPTVPVSDLFPDGIYPEGERQSYTEKCVNSCLCPPLPCCEVQLLDAAGAQILISVNFTVAFIVTANPHPASASDKSASD